MKEPQKLRYFINSLKRGLAVLHSLSSSAKGLTLSELAALNKINHSTANRYLFTLRELGYVVQDPLTKTYMLTPKILSLGFPFIRNLDIRSRLVPYLIELNQELDVTTECAILSGTEIVFVERSRSSDVFDLNLAVGSRLPSYCTGLGKAILAFIDLDEARQVIASIDFIRHTPYTIVDKDRFMREIELTRQRGYAVNNQEMALGVKTFAVPIMRDGIAEGACGISVHINRLKDSNLEQVFIKKLKEISQKTAI
ncbi:MAG TPA: IclR family transcriptional regulator [Desulfatiglandales bacterium]|nr:IclR family transcriptional regulator [Desulfatiglandales bacterium]